MFSANCEVAGPAATPPDLLAVGDVSEDEERTVQYVMDSAAQVSTRPTTYPRRGPLVCSVDTRVDDGYAA